MAERICENCMSRVPIGSERCPKCGIRFENTNPGGALPSGWVLGGRYTVGRYIDIDGEGVCYSAIDGDSLARVTVKEFMPVTLCAARDEHGAIKPKPGNEVLFKTTRMDYADLYATLLRMGQTEGLIQVLDVLEENNTAYAIMEKVEGPTLSEYLTRRERPVDAARAQALMKPILAGVEALHTANLVHRGISPENIVLESGGGAKLGGYGTLALRQQGSELKPKLYPGYCAPEQYAASEFEGKYTDVYALGAVLYRLVTGEAPQPAGERRQQDSQRPARTVNKEVPAFLSSGMARAMRLIPAERIQNIPDLRLALSGEGGRGSEAGRGFLGLSRQQMIIAGAAAAAVLVLVLIILLISAFTRNRNKPDSSSSLSVSSLSQSVSEALRMDNFVGKLYDEVVNNQYYTDMYTFEEPELVYSNDVEEGRIISQFPPADTDWDGETPVKFTVSQGKEPVTMPDFLTNHTTREQAETRLRELGILDYEIKTEVNDGKVEEGTVVKQDPAAGGSVKPGTDKVTITVAGRVETIPMPSITGKTQAEGTAELDRLNIQYRIETITNTVSFLKVGIIDTTDPPAGGEVATGATIVNVRVFGAFRMPNLESYKGKPRNELETYLTSIGVAYKSEKVPNTDPSKNAFVQDIGYVANGEVSSSTVVTIYYYDTATVTSQPPPPDSTG